jgi:mono/diheme cytochrome c family protein
MKRIGQAFAASCALGLAVLCSVGARADALVDRGAYLMNSIVACGNCHSPRGPDGTLIAERELSGGPVINAPIFSAVPSNITPDLETGIGRWTDDQIIDAIRNGKRPDGSIIGPPMPFAFYRDMSDSDVRAIVAYLRQVKPVSNSTAKSTYKIPLPASWGPPVTAVPETSPSDKVAYGRYLAETLGHCMDCHTPLVDGRNDMNRLGAGGNVFEAPGGGIVRSGNLTSGVRDGVAEWSDESLKTAIRSGVRPDGSKLVPLMAFDYYKNISDTDMNAIVSYIRELKAAR